MSASFSSKLLSFKIGVVGLPSRRLGTRLYERQQVEDATGHKYALIRLDSTVGVSYVSCAKRTHS
jgi:hypothetical protein